MPNELPSKIPRNVQAEPPMGVHSLPPKSMSAVSLSVLPEKLFLLSFTCASNHASSAPVLIS